jgi:hypothetical protein
MPLRIRSFGSATHDRVRSAVRAHDHAVTTRGPEVVQARPWRRVTRVPCGDTMVAVKEFRYAPFRAVGLWLTRQSYARRSAEIALRMAEHGLTVATPIAIAEGATHSYLLTRWVDEGVLLKDLLDELAEREGGGADVGDERRSVLRAVADHLGRMHRCRVTMEDYRKKNLRLVTTGDRPELVLFDFDTVQIGKVRWPERLLNLFTLRRGLGPEMAEQDLRFLVEMYLKSLYDGAAPEGQDAVLTHFLGREHLNRVMKKPFLNSCRTFWRENRNALPEPSDVRPYGGTRPVAR